MSAETANQNLSPVHRKHIMVDIETLGLSPATTICSIGAVCFTPSHIDPYLDAFYVECNVEQGRLINIDTLKWWSKQSIPMPIHGTTNLRDALLTFHDWYLLQKSHADEKIEVWSNGTYFDISVLCDAFEQHRIVPPWGYNAVRDYRTMSKMFPHIVRPPKHPEAHNALVDAKMQATHLSTILVHLNGMIERWEKNV